ncbi:MAG: 2-hydroxymuconate tautomerase [Candidatus Saccharicenans sp.]
MKTEGKMPLVEIHLLEGRTKAQKKALLEAVTRAIQESIQAPAETIRVWIQEFPKDEYMVSGVLASERSLKNKP